MYSYLPSTTSSAFSDENSIRGSNRTAVQCMYVLLLLREAFTASSDEVWLMRMMLIPRCCSLVYEASVLLTYQNIPKDALFIAQRKVIVVPSWAVLFSGCAVNSIAVMWENNIISL